MFVVATLAATAIPRMSIPPLRQPQTMQNGCSTGRACVSSVIFLSRCGILHDCSPDDFRDLRDDGVAEGSKAVHSAGYPMSHSTHVGFNPPLPSGVTPSSSIAVATAASFSAC